MVRRHHEQLALALYGLPQAIEQSPQTSPRPATRGARSPGARSAAAANLAEVARVRTTPSRDHRGRFVSFRTTDAPSWYVFCADGYRIPGEPSPEAIAPSAPSARHPLPRAVARSRRTPRTRFTRADLLIYLLMAIAYVATLWYGLHLPRPHR